MIKDQVIELMINNLILTPTEEASLKPETTFEDLAVDIIMFQDLMNEVQDEFGISIPTEEVDKIKTVNELVEAVEKRIKSA